MPRTAFISGPLDVTSEYFNTYYIPKIRAAMDNGDNFVMGPVDGVDTIALDYLIGAGVAPERITVFMTHSEYKIWKQRYDALGVKTHEEGVETRDRDAAMTRNSDYDILRYRTEAEAKKKYGPRWLPKVTATEMNERRRKGDTSEAYALGPPTGDADGSKWDTPGDTKKFGDKVGELFGRICGRS